MSGEAERQAILEHFTCAHVRLTRAPAVIRAGDQEAYRWAPGCVHPKMHARFDGEVEFCERCPCYMSRPGAR